jgi:hypothetical protein
MYSLCRKRQPRDSTCGHLECKNVLAGFKWEKRTMSVGTLNAENNDHVQIRYIKGSSRIVTSMWYGSLATLFQIPPRDYSLPLTDVQGFRLTLSLPTWCPVIPYAIFSPRKIIVAEIHRWALRSNCNYGVDRDEASVVLIAHSYSSHLAEASLVSRNLTQLFSGTNKPLPFLDGPGHYS